MSGRKSFRPDRVEQYAREHARGGKDGPGREVIADDAILRPYGMPKRPEERATRYVARRATDAADEARLLDILGLAPGAPAPARKPRRSAGSKPTSPRVRECARLIESGKSVEQVAIKMRIGTDTVRDYWRLWQSGGAS